MIHIVCMDVAPLYYLPAGGLVMFMIFVTDDDVCLFTYSSSMIPARVLCGVGCCREQGGEGERG